MPVILAGDVPLNVRTDGDDRRPALLLLNPLGTTIELWDPLVERLAGTNFVIRFDMRGHGGSGASTSFDLAALGRDALVVLDALEVPRAHVFGSSLGGLVAVWLAVEHPERVDRLVLASTAPRLGPDRWWLETIDLIEENGLDATADRIESMLFSSAWRDAVPTLEAAARDMLLRTPAETYVAGAQLIRDTNLKRVMQSVRASTLLIVGEDDPLLAHHPPTDLLAAIPDSEAVSVGGAAHQVILEHPDAIAEIVGDFLTDPDARQ